MRNRNLKFTCFLVLLCVLISIWSSPLNAQDINFEATSIGIIYNDSVISGTGFVLNSDSTVYTCAHVVDTTKIITFRSVGSKKLDTLNLKRFDMVNDISILVSESSLTEKPFEQCRNVAYRPNEIIYYMGFDNLESSKSKLQIKIHSSTITSFGKTSRLNKFVNFIEFEGNGIPGYSGGPVINNRGEVIAIMAEAGFFQPIKLESKKLVNRAFGIVNYD